jgi:hypothetical protein
MPLQKDELDEVAQAIEGFARGVCSFEESLAILHQYQYSAEEIRKVLDWMGLNGFLNDDSLNLIWTVVGAGAFVQIAINGYSVVPGVVTLLSSKLIDEPESFTPEMLNAINTSIWACRPLVKEAQLKRLQRKAALMIRQPAEVNRDSASVKTRVNDFGFPSELNELLTKVDYELGTNQDGFDEAGTLKHVRTFVEELHKRCAITLRERCPETQNKVGNPNSEDKTPLDKHQGVLDFLERHGVLTNKMKKLSEALYGILSNEGVHAITARREYVRLCRNMVIEYALVLFHEMDRRIQSPTP